MAAQQTTEQEEFWDLLRKICPQLPGESAKAYQAFADTAFSGLSVRRLLDRYKEVSDLISESYDTAIAPPPTLKLNTLFTWSNKHQWQKRLKDWFPICEAYKRKLACDREKVIIDRWNNNRLRLLDGVDEMIQRAEVMLKHPHIKKTVKRRVTSRFEGEQIEQEITLAPSNWQLRDIALFYKVALELMREVVGDRQLAIDRLHADGYVIIDPSVGGDNEAIIEQFLSATERLEELEI
ncbi:hypothetical protein H6F96_19575 [Microcoleus sp. FACHB-53]|nr:hypothetical protein [Microcoleus sp. FACHB-53]